MNTNKIKFTARLIIMMGLVSCSTTSTIVEAPIEQPKAPEVKIYQNLTPCTTLADIDPAIRSSTEDAFTLYRDEIRAKDYSAAKVIWKQAYFTAPGSNGKMKVHFDDGIKIYDYLYGIETDSLAKGMLVDTILGVYDKRLECFEDDGTILARKAFNSYYKYQDYTDEDEVFEMFREVVRLKDLQTDYFAINPLSRLLYDRVLSEEISYEEASPLALKIFDIVEEGLATCKGEYCDAWNVINEYSPPLLSQLEGLKGFYSCDYFMDRYFDQYLADSTDCDNVSEVYLKMLWGGCDITESSIANLKSAKDKMCYVAPPPPGPCKEAYTLLNEGRFDEAIEKYKECMSSKSDNAGKAPVALIIAKIYYAHIKNFTAARQYARQASQLDLNSGEPLMLIGKLYASSGPLCGPGTGWDSQVVTWVAIDKFNEAKRRDPAVADEANKWIGRYSKYMPTKEDVFFRRLEAGQSYYVPCWIKESTTIRTSD